MYVAQPLRPGTQEQNYILLALGSMCSFTSLDIFGISEIWLDSSILVHS